jgi:predicted adenylyl cyclase CyaB
MARNIEIKARIASVEALIPHVAAIAEAGAVEITQDDTFFGCERGRLKLRVFSPRSGELIFYQRGDSAGPKESSYWRALTSEPESLRECLRRAYGETGHVAKTRTLFMIGRTRVHLDRVVGLGDFLELEVVLEEGEPSEAGVREAERIMSKLGIATAQLIQGAYLDLKDAR